VLCRQSSGWIKLVTKKHTLAQAFTPKGNIKKKYTVILSIIAFALILIVWSVLSYSGKVDPLFMPTPGDTVYRGYQMFAESNFMNDILMTVSRVMSGFAIAALISIPLGILIGTYAPVSAFLESVFSFIRYMPASAFIPLFILWIGIGENEKVAIIILGSLPQLVLMIANDIKSVDASLIEVSYTLGTSKADVLWKVILPKSLPSILDTLRIVLGWAWTYVIVAEMVGASSGIGYMILQSQRMLSISKIFVGILTIGFIGLLVDLIFKWLYRVLFSWNEK
jgi:NitT/TauT family transport system permease protein